MRVEALVIAVLFAPLSACDLVLDLTRAPDGGTGDAPVDPSQPFVTAALTPGTPRAGTGVDATVALTVTGDPDINVFLRLATDGGGGAFDVEPLKTSIQLDSEGRMAMPYQWHPTGVAAATITVQASYDDGFSKFNRAILEFTVQQVLGNFDTSDTVIAATSAPQLIVARVTAPADVEVVGIGAKLAVVAVSPVFLAIYDDANGSPDSQIIVTPPLTPGTTRIEQTLASTTNLAAGAPVWAAIQTAQGGSVAARNVAPSDALVADPGGSMPPMSFPMDASDPLKEPVLYLIVGPRS